MPEWLIIVLVFFVVTRLIRGGACGRWRQDRMLERREARRLSSNRDRVVSPPVAETPMQALQRRFVDGSITVEQYERELDRLLRH